MAQIRASTVQQKNEDVNAALQYAASFHCLVVDFCGPLKWKARSAARSGVQQRAKIAA